MPQADFQHLPAAPVDRIEALEDVTLLAVAPVVVAGEEALIVVVEASVWSPYDVVTAGMSIPEAGSSVASSNGPALLDRIGQTAGSSPSHTFICELAVQVSPKPATAR